MYSMPVRTVCTFLTSPRITAAAYMLPRVASSQPGTTIGRFLSQAATIHQFFGFVWVAFLQLPAAKIFIQDLVRKICSARAPRRDPLFEHRLLDPPHRL